VTARAPTIAKQYPAAVRFRNGRTLHRVRVPDEHRWWDLLQAACGKTGYKTDAWIFNDVRDCRGCEAAVADDNPRAA